jgi:CRISPR-associated endonuclease Cas3-HD
VQRAGRCARFENESGIVHVYDAPSCLPYADESIDAARRIVADIDSLDPATCADWVERAHRAEDQAALAGYNDLARKRHDFILGRQTGDGVSGAAAYIRKGEDAVRVFVLANPKDVKPQERQAIQLYRKKLLSFQNRAWVYDGEDWIAGGDVRTAYALALPPSVAGYTKELGLILGTAGTIESPSKPGRCRPGYSSGLRMEPWDQHTQNVVREALLRLEQEGLDQRFAQCLSWTALLHDLGKLQRCWQQWARDRQAARGVEVKTALAHTDYEWPADKGQPRPPKHAAASTVFGHSYLQQVTTQERTAVSLAVLSHHGGTLLGEEKIDGFHSSADAALEGVGLKLMKAPKPTRLFASLGDDLAEDFADIWPLAAILSRVLRLSDQKATSEATYG